MGATLLNVRLWHRYFCVKFTKFVKIFFTEHLPTIASICLFGCLDAEKGHRYMAPIKYQ